MGLRDQALGEDLIAKPLSLFQTDEPAIDPFIMEGSVVLPNGNSMPAGMKQVEPEPVDEFGSVSGAQHAFKNTDKKQKQPNHHDRAMKLLTEMHPGCLLYVCEKRVTLWSGQVVKVDQWGFGDICGITSKGGWLMANVTTTAAMGAHMRDYTNPTNTHGQAKRPVVDILEQYLALRGVFYIIGFHKAGHRWEPTVWTVDQAMIDAFKARKRRL